jgi:hypothetical protein
VYYSPNYSSLPDHFTTSWSPSHIDLCHFKVTILAPLQWAHQTLSSFGFPAFPYSSCMHSLLSVWSMSNNITAFVLGLKSTGHTTPKDLPKGMQLKLFHSHLHTHVYCSTIHNSQVMETAKMPHYWWMNFKNVLFIHNGILLSHEEEWNLVIHR